MRLFVRLSLIGLVALVAAGFWLSQSQQDAAPKPTPKVEAGQCTDAGTSVVIDFGSDSSEPIIEKCVLNYSGNSWNLLLAAGLNISGTTKYPIGFVCRINAYPDTSREKCIETPGGNSGSWAFFIAESGSDEWIYSPYGASSHRVKCGSAEGWRFLEKNESLKTAPRIQPVTNTCEK